MGITQTEFHSMDNHSIYLSCLCNEAPIRTLDTKAFTSFLVGHTLCIYGHAWMPGSNTWASNTLTAWDRTQRLCTGSFKFLLYASLTLVDFPEIIVNYENNSSPWVLTNYQTLPVPGIPWTYTSTCNPVFIFVGSPTLILTTILWCRQGRWNSPFYKYKH